MHFQWKKRQKTKLCELLMCDAKLVGRFIYFIYFARFLYFIPLEINILMVYFSFFNQIFLANFLLEK